MKKRTFITIFLIFCSLTFIWLPLMNVHAYPILQIDSEIPYNVGASFSLRISAITDDNGQVDGISIMAFFDNFIPALSTPIVAPYFLNEEILFHTTGVSSGERLFSIKCQDYLGNVAWKNMTIFVDKTGPTINWMSTNTERVKHTEYLIFNWSVVDAEGHFEKITITFSDGSESLISSTPIGFGYKLFKLNPFEFQRFVSFTFTAQDLAENKQIIEGQCEVYIPLEERPEYPQTYVDVLNDTWGNLRNRDAWVTAGIFAGIFAIAIPATITTVVRFKKKRNIPVEEV